MKCWIWISDPVCNKKHNRVSFTLDNFKTFSLTTILSVFKLQNLLTVMNHFLRLCSVLFSFHYSCSQLESIIYWQQKIKSINYSIPESQSKQQVHANSTLKINSNHKIKQFQVLIIISVADSISQQKKKNNYNL